MAQVKKTFMFFLTFLAGLLLVLAGFDLITLSNDLIKYVGIILLIGSILYYLFGGNSTTKIEKGGVIDGSK